MKLSAATSRLTKTARCWFNLCTGSINRSWITFKIALISRFKRKILYSTVMQKVESRKWIFSRESFSDYAMDKLTLMTPLKLPEEDSIQLLINGISSVAIKATAVSLRINSFDEFLRDSIDVIRKSPTAFKKNKSKDQSRPDFPKTGQDKNGRNLFYSYCRGRNHIKDCFKLKRKELANSTQLKKNVPSSMVASVSESENSTNTIAFVDTADTKKIVTSNIVLKITKIDTSIYNLLALLDTGSRISFISRQLFYNFFELTDSSTTPSCSYNALNGTPIQIKNSVTTSFELELLPKIVSNVTYFRK